MKESAAGAGLAALYIIGKRLFGHGRQKRDSRGRFRRHHRRRCRNVKRIGCKKTHS